MANLAIKGHTTRGKEVIEILEMLGGKNTTNLDGELDNTIYIINSSYYGEIDYMPYRTDNYIVFTLEEFLEKFPYKIGDKVIAYIEGCLAQFTIQGIRWNHELNRVEYRICSSWRDTSLILPYKEKTTDKANKAVFDSNAQCCDIMNHLIKEETMEGKLMPRIDLTGYCKDKYIIDLGNYEIKEEKGVIYAVRKQSEYPNTYEECCEVLRYEPDRQTVTGYDAELIENLQTLKLCRDAYWKIAVDWKPNLESKQHKFAISNVGNKISFEVYGEYNSILCFPTAEMRDAFYENFKDLIEQCKELL